MPGSSANLNFQSGFGTRLSDFLAASPGGISIYSGYRTVPHQNELWQKALVKYGSPEAARKWVAPPGRSRHNSGTAADLNFSTDEARNWAHQHAGEYGLNFRLGNEPWHVEMAGGSPTMQNTSFHMPTMADAPGIVGKGANLLTQGLNELGQPPSATTKWKGWASKLIGPEATAARVVPPDLVKNLISAGQDYLRGTPQSDIPYTDYAGTAAAAPPPTVPDDKPGFGDRLADSVSQMGGKPEQQLSGQASYVIPAQFPPPQPLLDPQQQQAIAERNDLRRRASIMRQLLGIPDEALDGTRTQIS